TIMFIRGSIMPSFDVVSELDKHEVTNAVDNAMKELDRRYDLKGKGRFEFNDKQLTVTITTEAEFQLEQMLEILRLSLTKRKIDVQWLELKGAEDANKNKNLDIALRKAIEEALFRLIVETINDSKIKEQAAIQGEEVRLTANKRDALQATLDLQPGSKLVMPL